MSNILSAIQDDIDEYLALCERFNEDAQYTVTAARTAMGNTRDLSRSGRVKKIGWHVSTR